MVCIYPFDCTDDCEKIMFVKFNARNCAKQILESLEYLWLHEFVCHYNLYNATKHEENLIIMLKTLPSPTI